MVAYDRAPERRRGAQQYGCENKDRLGERGEGNCRPYREICQRPVALAVRRTEGGLSE